MLCFLGSQCQLSFLWRPFFVVVLSSTFQTGFPFALRLSDLRMPLSGWTKMGKCLCLFTWVLCICRECISLLPPFYSHRLIVLHFKANLYRSSSFKTISFLEIRLRSWLTFRLCLKSPIRTSTRYLSHLFPR